MQNASTIAIAAKAGIQCSLRMLATFWIPAYAGMTMRLVFAAKFWVAGNARVSQAFRAHRRLTAC